MPFLKVKICGIKTLDDALMAAELGADMLGLNFYEPSPRYIAPENAKQLADGLRGKLAENCPVLVGVFVNENTANIKAIMAQVGLDFAQLSGDEPVEHLAELNGRAFKSIRPADITEAKELVETVEPFFSTNITSPSILVDAYHPKLYGGTGEQASTGIALAVKAAVPRLMLAGGLNPDNIAERVQAIQPWGVDVASGVEVDGQPGVKDHAKIKAFVDVIKQITI